MAKTAGGVGLDRELCGAASLRIACGLLIVALCGVSAAAAPRRKAVPAKSPVKRVAAGRKAPPRAVRKPVAARKPVTAKARPAAPRAVVRPPAAPRPAAPQTAGPKPAIAGPPLPPRRPEPHRPDPPPATSLGREVRLAGFALRPPEGYRLEKPQQLPGSTGLTWIGARRRDGTTPYLFVQLINPVGRRGQNVTPDRAMRGFLKVEQQRSRSFQCTGTERASLGRLRGVRARWQTVDRRGGRPTYGVCYIAADGPQLIWIVSRDVAPYHEPALRIAEEAALTFRKL